MDLRPLALVAVTTSLVACTVLNEMDGYAGGAADTGAAVAADSGTTDSAAPDTAKPDTAKPDTAASDSSAPADTSVSDSAAVDTGVDSGTVDSGTVDSGTVDSGTVDTSVTDAPGCGTSFVGFGLSEFQVRGTFGTGDKREWIELTNYTGASLDVSGVTVKIVSGTTERASFTFPAGTNVAADGAVVIAGEKVAFSADVMASFGLGAVFEFGKNDWLVNSSASEVRLIAPSCSTPFETAVIPSKTYAIGQPWAYPAPGASCPASARLTATGTLGAAWKEVPTSTPAYGSYAIEVGMQNLYGTPTKPNNVACP